jgi:glutathione synthase/RimK-type ligase-like ATP-grasp enzyme
MKIFDLGISYNWEYDVDFVSSVEKNLQEAGLSTYVIHQNNVLEVKEDLIHKGLAFNCYIDRAWDVDDRFEEIGKILQRRKTKIFNPYKKVLHAIDKASMHLEFMTAGLNVPYSIIIPPHSQKEDILLSVDDLAILGRPFIIKPCNTTGGGIGVITGAESLKEVVDERIAYTNDKYLIQEKIYPRIIEDKRAWFRCFWAFGKMITVLWDDQTHVYEEISEEFKTKINVKKLNQIIKTIYGLIQLDFFSTEIVFTNENKFVVIDYVNDQCDMRLKSKHVDGIPDVIVNQIISYLMP